MVCAVRLTSVAAGKRSATSSQTWHISPFASAIGTAGA
jgi:hypothetical protein